MNYLKLNIVLMALFVGLFMGCSKKQAAEPVDNSIATVSSFVGNPVAGPVDGTGTLAYFNRPIGMAFDASGVLYVADSENGKIRKVTSAGVVTTFAGSGDKSSADGSAQYATFNAPYGVAVDASGNCYVSESTHIRKITPAGLVSTLINNNLSRPGNLAIDASGNLYVSDYALNKIFKISPTGVMTTFAGGAGSGATALVNLNSPGGLAFDASGNLYVSDSGNNMIRKITQAGVVTTFAGTGFIGSANGPGASATFNFPEGIAIDAAGNIYVADKFNRLIRMISPAGIVSTLAGTGAAGSVNGYGDVATFFQPLQIAIDKQGVLYITDTTDQIRKIVIKK
jgi:sugar lactone lactonase YvrE